MVNVIVMQWLSLIAPQHPKNVTMKMMQPMTISRTGVLKNWNHFMYEYQSSLKDED